MRAILILTLVFASACSEPTRESFEAQPPRNLILISIDTLRGDALEHPGLDLVGLPALQEGAVTFQRAFSHAPMTLPAHTSLFASRPPHETGVRNNWQVVPAELPLLSSHLQEQGFHTRAVASLATMWNDEPGTSLDRGFDSFEHGPEWISRGEETLERIEASLDELDGDEPFYFLAHFSDPHEPYNSHGTFDRSADVRLGEALIGQPQTSDMTIWRRWVTLGPGETVIRVDSENAFKVRELWFDRGGTRLPVEILEGKLQTGVERVVARVSNSSDGPVDCILGLWVNDIPGHRHIPRRYGREVEHVDQQLALLLESLERRGLLEDTLVVLTSDHGEGLGEHRTWGHVQNLYDEQIHVPLVFRLPEGHPAAELLARRADELVRHIDVVPTILELMELPALPGQRGRSLLANGDRLHVAETSRPEARRDLIALRDERYKAVYDSGDDTFELYDLREDPGEAVDLADALDELRPGWRSALRAIERPESAGGVAMDGELRDKLASLGYL